VSVVVSQPIKWAMRVLKPNEGKAGQVVDSGEGVLCEYVNPYSSVMILTKQINAPANASGHS
jgi:hypothetical protein